MGGRRTQQLAPLFRAGASACLGKGAQGMSAPTRRGRALVNDPFRQIIMLKNRLFMSTWIFERFVQNRVILFVGECRHCRRPRWMGQAFRIASQKRGSRSRVVIAATPRSSARN